MRVLLTGGGTAGHINPAIAIAETIKDRVPDAEIAFVGTPKGLENKLVSSAGIPMYHVRVQGFSRSLNPKNIISAYLAFTSPIHAKKIIREFKPDVVIGTGGYVSWPLIVAAGKMGIASVVHESNAVPGMAVKKLVPYADEILVNFAGTASYLKNAKNIAVVGNPMRRGFRTGNRPAARAALGLEANDRLILSFGGSLGADMINRSCLDLMQNYSSVTPHIHHIHACGARNYEKVKEKFDKMFKTPPENITLLPYIDNMPELMSAADIVISRSGAMTISELALAGKASILIPSPNVANDHQYKNAHLLECSNAAMLVEESPELSRELQSKVETLFLDNGLRQMMQNRILRFAAPNANEAIFSEICKLLQSKQAEKNK